MYITDIHNIELTKERYEEIITLYNNFSKINESVLTFKKLNQIIASLNINHHILFGIEDGVIIGAITLLVEQKIIHDGKCVGHIEDFVVHEDHRNKGFGRQLMKYATDLAKYNNCYKCILDCDPDLERFYMKNGFIKKGITMGMYF